MATSYISDLMCKLLTLFFFLSSMSVVFSETYIERLGIVKEDCYVVKNPSNNTEKLVKLRKNQTIVISGEKGNYYRIQLNNYTSGYVNKIYIAFKNVLKDEKYTYSLKKIKYDIRNILDKFNKKIRSADYYKIYGNIPQLSLYRCYIEDRSLVVELIYKCDKRKEVGAIKISEEISNIMNKLIEVIFYKMIEISMLSYRVEILAVDNKYDNLFKDYIVYRYSPSGKSKGTLNELENDFWENLSTTKKLREVFKECP